MEEEEEAPGTGGGGMAPFGAEALLAEVVLLEVALLDRACLARDLPLDVGPNSDGDAGEMGEGLAEEEDWEVRAEAEVEARREGEGAVVREEGTGRTQIRSRSRLCYVKRVEVSSWTFKAEERGSSPSRGRLRCGEGCRCGRKWRRR